MFRRQRPIGNFIVDFVCLPLFLIIEVDGESHELEETLKKDRAKQRFLEESGFTVLRLSSQEVFEGGASLTDVVRSTIAGLEKDKRAK